MSVDTSRNAIIDIIEHVSIPFAKELEESEIGKKYLNTDEKRFQHQLDVVYLTIVILYNTKKALEKLQRGAEAHNGMGIPVDVMRHYLSRYFAHLIHYIETHEVGMFEEDVMAHLDEYEAFFMHHYRPSLDAPAAEAPDAMVQDEEGFFDFDSETVDDSIDQMHHRDEKKVSAREYMQEDTTEIEMIHDIEDQLERYDAHVGLDDTLSPEKLQIAKETIDAFVNLFNLSYEFKDIAYSLESLNALLDKVDTSDTEKMQMLKLFLDTIMDDLETFKKEVFDEQTAQDIHYLDASLLANIAQIEIMLNTNTSEAESSEGGEDDFELF